jgi:hypothetical protein
MRVFCELTYPDRYNRASSQNQVGSKTSGFWTANVLAVDHSFLHVRRLEFSDKSNMVRVNPSFPCVFHTTNRTCQSPVTADVMTAGDARGCYRAFCVVLPVATGRPPPCWVCRIPLSPVFGPLSAWRFFMVLKKGSGFWKQSDIVWTIRSPEKVCEENMCLVSAAQQCV